MKALFKHSIQQPLCQNELSFWSSLRRWRSGFVQRCGANVSRVFAGNLRVNLSAIKRATSNNRTYAALILLFVVAPVSEVAYMLFDRSAPIITWYAGQHWFTHEGVRVEGWYFMNYYWMLFQLGPHIQYALFLEKL